jgi:hypothetical protein
MTMTNILFLCKGLVLFFFNLVYADTQRTENCEAFSSKTIIKVDFLMNDWIPVTFEKTCACNIACQFYGPPPGENSWKNPTGHDIVIMLHYLHTFAEGERLRDFPEQIFGYLELEPPIPGEYMKE